jgi:hypothetical protein
MRQLDVPDVQRSKKFCTTRHGSRVAHHPNLLDRQFNAHGPNQLQITDSSIAQTWSGIA